MQFNPIANDLQTYHEQQFRRYDFTHVFSIYGAMAHEL